MRGGGRKGRRIGGGGGVGGGVAEAGGVYSFHAWPQSYDHRPLHPSNAGTEPVGFLPTRLTLFASSAIRREVFGESHEGLEGGMGVIASCTVGKRYIGW